MNRVSADYVCVMPEFLHEMLNAATSTAMAHRDKPNELYALGQLEASANLIYVMAAAQGFPDLEEHCQRVAFDALKRLSALATEQHHAELWPAGKRA